MKNQVIVSPAFNPTTDVMETFENRLNQLEQESARWKASAKRSRIAATCFGAIILAGGGLAANEAFEISEVVTTKRLEILDENNNLLVAAYADERGGRLDIWNQEGNNVFRMASNPAGGDLNIWNKAGNPVFGAYATDAGAELGVWSPDGKRLIRGSSGAQGGLFEVRGGDGSAAVVAEANSSGGGLRLVDGSGTNRFEARAAGTGGSVDLMTGAGNRGLRLDTAENGGRVRVMGPEEALRCTLDTAAMAGRIMLHGGDGDQIFAAEADAQVGTRLELAEAGGPPRLTLTAESTGGAIALLNTAGQAVVTAGASNPTGGGFVDVANAAGTRVMNLGAEADGCGRMDLANADGTIVYTIDGVARSGAALAMFDARGQQAVLLGTRAEGGLLNLFNERAIPVFIAGYAEGDLGGAMAIKNASGLSVVQLLTDSANAGVVRILDGDGKRPRTIKHAFE